MITIWNSYYICGNCADIADNCILGIFSFPSTTWEYKVFRLIIEQQINYRH